MLRPWTLVPARVSTTSGLCSRAVRCGTGAPPSARRTCIFTRIIPLAGGNDARIIPGNFPGVLLFLSPSTAVSHLKTLCWIFKKPCGRKQGVQKTRHGLGGALARSGDRESALHLSPSAVRVEVRGGAAASSRRFAAAFSPRRGEAQARAPPRCPRALAPHPPRPRAPAVGPLRRSPAADVTSATSSSAVDVRRSFDGALYLALRGKGLESRTAATPVPPAAGTSRASAVAPPHRRPLRPASRPVRQRNAPRITTRPASPSRVAHPPLSLSPTTGRAATRRPRRIMAIPPWPQNGATSPADRRRCPRGRGAAQRQWRPRGVAGRGDDSTCVLRFQVSIFCLFFGVIRDGPIFDLFFSLDSGGPF